MKRLVLMSSVLAILASACAAADVRPEADDLSGSTAKVAASSSESSSASDAPSNASEAPEEKGGATITDDSTPQDSTGSEGNKSPSPSSDAYDGPLASLVNIALADLAGRLGISQSDISVVSAESMVWPNGALGCPQPDMSYTQVLVDGALIVLSANSATYNYHSGGARDPFLCVPTKTVPGQTSTTLDSSAGGKEDQ